MILAYEEAIGFMCGTAVLDKDGISAAVEMAELAAFLTARNLRVEEKLNELYHL